MLIVIKIFIRNNRINICIGKNTNIFFISICWTIIPPIRK